MTEQRFPSRDTILQSLTSSDEQRRKQRAERLEWLLRHNSDKGGAWMGSSSEMEVFALRSEAQQSYIEGLFIGTVLLAMAFVEQTVIAKLLARDLTRDEGITITDAMKLARAHRVFDGDLLDRAVAMANVRNACAHLRTIEHESSFTRRWLEQRCHPDEVREDDARDALKLMDGFYAATLDAASGSSQP